MAYAEIYQRQVRLLLQALPFVAQAKEFALKGGTAINLFIRDMPRLSVDIDLTYLPVQSREASLPAIDAGMRRIGAAIRAGLAGARVAEHELRPEGTITRLVVSLDGVQIKIEVTPVMRGSVFDPVVKGVSPAVEDAFGFAETQVVSFPDLYAGKIVAALDRQHPRDLFDVRDLLANEGLTDELRRAFLAYLLSHNRPMHEVLRPTQKDISQEFERNFDGMTATPVALDELLAAREQLIAGLVGNMPDSHRQFLLSFKRGEPDWALVDLPGVADLPAVRWRQINLGKAPDREPQLARLEAVLMGNR
jgi:predicted nucleotidyltransferase component of viral defense system